MLTTLDQVISGWALLLGTSGDRSDLSALYANFTLDQVFWHVTLPNIRWGLLYGVILTNARAMGEFGAVSVISGGWRGFVRCLGLVVGMFEVCTRQPSAG